MSDMTFHLDESLQGLAKINNIRAEMENQEAWNAKDENEKKDLESQLHQAEGNVPFHTMMGRSHVKLMEEFTKTTKEPFLTGEIVERLAAVSLVLILLPIYNVTDQMDVYRLDFG